MPIAGGENEHTLYGFRELLGAGAVDIAQPDIGSCGALGGAPCDHGRCRAQVATACGSSFAHVRGAAG